MDDYVWSLQDDRRRPVWAARLSSGATVWMDDGRPGCVPSSAWVRLAERLRRSGERIDLLWLRFRSHEVRPLPERADGYYFSLGAAMTDGLDEAVRFYAVGALVGGVLTVTRWRVPELLPIDSDRRDPATAGPRLILNTSL